ncbi:MAG TPA: ROK family protein [Dinghuibacter sp.]|uniref:ROK family protein n=1 Tax=Dinghuibacter sp. TaxID=2024697 RepID=UPI002CED3A1F|nr:ROK family protein [Dinghuibacter sp.]HTJ14806.1 ROK family protein [Dinghuibacter sp.]
MKIGVDIGGSHVTAAWVNDSNRQVLEETLTRAPLDAAASPRAVIGAWAGAIRSTLERLPGQTPEAVGLAMPGPFDYSRGISLIEGLHKYDRLLGLNVRQALTDALGLPVFFENDAFCFGLGEALIGKAAGHRRAIALTLGTGLGCAFIEDGRILRSGSGVPPGGFLYNMSFRDGIAEDYVSARGLQAAYGPASPGVRALADLARKGDPSAKAAFAAFGRALGEVLAPWVNSFQSEIVILGGSITHAADLFLPTVQLTAPIACSDRMELSSIAGAASIAIPQKDNGPWRKTTQPLLPITIERERTSAYDRFPFHALENGRIHRGYETLAAWIAQHPKVRIDGYAGVDWDALRTHLTKALQGRYLWYETVFRTEEDIRAMTAGDMGEPGSVWGKITERRLDDFIDLHTLRLTEPDGPSILLGPGAALAPWEDAPVIYIDLPKNEIQYRMRAGSTTNLGMTAPEAPTEMYKRYYFIDWVVLNHHREKIKDNIAIVADGQWKDDITWTTAEALSKGLHDMARDQIRVRPWFEAGAWGGQWLKAHIPGLPKEEVNYAWSFELIVPENGLVFESEGNLLEVAFDWLMEQESKAVLGRDAQRFNTEFPIRFDFLDTFDGGNLSIQCHPYLAYIREHFGERITQDETYYILDCAPDAGVYLGFQEDIEAGAFRQALEQSQSEETPVDIERFVQRHAASKHDLFLIPHGTIHSSGKNNLVLEISATPYIYTFKMYDWLRLDLNGEPRPINIAHAFNNLDFSRKGDQVARELISQPRTLSEGLVHLPTHPDHFYDVHRLEFSGTVTVDTEDGCHVLMVVEGKGVSVETPGGRKYYPYAETFVIPAAARQYTLEAQGPVKVVKAFIKR